MSQSWQFDLNKVKHCSTFRNINQTVNGKRNQKIQSLFERNTQKTRQLNYAVIDPKILESHFKQEQTSLCVLFFPTNNIELHTRNSEELSDCSKSHGPSLKAFPIVFLL